MAEVDIAISIEAIRASTKRCYDLSATEAANKQYPDDVARIRLSLAYVLSRETEWWSNQMAKARIDEPGCTLLLQKIETALANLTICFETLGSSIDDQRNWLYKIQLCFTGKHNLRTELLKAEAMLNQTLLDLNHDDNNKGFIAQYDASLHEKFLSLQGTDEEKLSFFIKTMDNIPYGHYNKPNETRIHWLQQNWKLVICMVLTFIFGIVVVVAVKLRLLHPDETTQESVPCFVTSSELRTSVINYINNDTSVRVTYGTNIGDWCVDSIEDFSWLFDRTFYDTFNEDISKWNTSSAKNMSHMFHNANTFNGNISSWDVSNVIDMSYMFVGADAFIGDLSSWDVSKVINMSAMFSGAYTFAGDLSSWDVSNVIDMSRMFDDAEAFNCDLSSWDVSNVIDMSEMFSDAYYFNCDLSSWDVSKVTGMKGMFNELIAFNHDLSSWDVSNVIDMSYMFTNADAFNGNLSSWDVSKVTDMSGMFYGSDDFNGDLSSWDVSNVIDMSNMFYYAHVFNQNLCTWGNRLNSNTDVTGMFEGTVKCPSTSNPSFNNTPPGPFCYEC